MIRKLGRGLARFVFARPHEPISFDPVSFDSSVLPMGLIDWQTIEGKETKRSFRGISLLVPDFVRGPSAERRVRSATSMHHCLCQEGRIDHREEGIS